MRLLAAAGVAVLCLGAVTAFAGTRPSNIVLIVTEDLSPRLGSYGDTVARTPRLDRLAREGVRFTNAFATAPVCAPSRAALAMGVYAQSIGAQHMRTSRGWEVAGQGKSFRYLAVPPPELKAFPELLRRAGWFTVNHRKTDFQIGDPFTIWDEYDPDEMLHWRDAPPGVPFFAWINPDVTHESEIWPPRDEQEAARRPRVTDPNAVVVPPFLPDTPVTRLDLARHYDNIARLDAQVGTILDALAADGVLDQTIVIFTADHGDGLPHAKRDPYDAGLHVPLIVRFPDGRGAGTVRTDLVSFIDMAPTVLSLAGVGLPDWLRGQPFIGPARAAPRRYVYAASDRNDKVAGYWRSVRDARFQYLVNRMPERPLLEKLKFRDLMPTMRELWRLHEAHALTPLQESQFSAPRPREELYDTRADPDETRNLAHDPRYEAELARLRAALADFSAETPDFSQMSEKKMARKMWPKLKEPVTAAPVAKRTRWGEGVEIALESASPGASIGWRLAGDPPQRWRLYVGPIHAAARDEIQAKAVRYGWKESAVVRSGP
ncbi:MAG TPA: sulfatase [Myxococcota bacterium]|nr:sulfatase [Myxococcota bacterium]